MVLDVHQVPADLLREELHRVVGGHDADLRRRTRTVVGVCGAAARDQECTGRDREQRFVMFRGYQR